MTEQYSIEKEAINYIREKYRLIDRDFAKTSLWKKKEKKWYM